MVLKLPLSLLAAGLLASAVAPAGAEELGAAERAFIHGHGPFTYCVDPDWPPYEIIDAEGAHQGIAADLLRMAAERAGVPLRLVVTRNWDETIAASRAGACDIVSFLNQSPRRDEWLIFTAPIFVDRNVIVTREEHPYIDDLGAAAGQTMALPKGTSIEERVRRDFPHLRIVTTESEAEAFAMVSGRKADMTMRSLIVAVYTIKKDGWFNLKISGQVPGYDNHLRIGVRKDLPMLRDILDRGVASISLAERAEIGNRHVSIKVQTGIDVDLILRIVGVFSVILLTSLFWVAKLRKLNRKLHALSRTDPLTGLANRAALAERLDREYQRFVRYGRPLSAVLLDLDHFKAVNDELGHATGDAVLSAFARLATATARSEDLVGRWGGEEFLILCGETDAGQALALADRLCAAARAHDFGTGRRQTVSAGIAGLAAGDSADDLISRADAALYLAKENGRDQARGL
ncbi:MAG: diguanylate cyclase [Pseudomonadota bacterium]